MPARPWPPARCRRAAAAVATVPTDGRPAVVGDPHRHVGVGEGQLHLHAGRARRRASARWSVPPAPPGRRSARPPGQLEGRADVLDETSRPVPRTRSTSALSSREPRLGGEGGRPFPFPFARVIGGAPAPALRRRRAARRAGRRASAACRSAPGGPCSTPRGWPRPPGPGRRLRQGGGVGQGDHHLDVVRDHVVHLPRDAGPFRDRGQRRLLVALELQPLRPARPASRAGCAGPAPPPRPAAR